MNTGKMKKRRYIPQQIVLALALSTAALQASAESVNFNSNINIKKEDPCGIRVTSQGTAAAASYKIDAQGNKKLVLNGVLDAKVTAEASGGADCRIATIKLTLNNGERINDSSALSSATSDVYFPFDYALGDTQVVNAKGETVDEAQVFDRISVNRKLSESNIHPARSEVIDRPTVLIGDNTYHLHKGNIPWQTNKNIYLGTDSVPFWLGSAFDSVTFNGADSKTVTFSLVPVLSSLPYDKATGNASSATLNSDDVFSNTSVFTVTTI